MPKTGPRTDAGKKVSSLNSLTHGLNIYGFLPCKGSRCYFIDMCPVAIQALQEIPYGSPCPVELAKYNTMAKCIDADADLIMLNILQDRQRMFLAIGADITREVNGRQSLALGYRYRQQITSKAYKLTRKLLGLDNDTWLKQNMNILC